MRMPSTPLRIPASPITRTIGGAMPHVRVSMTLDQWKGMFFREDRILQKMDRATRRAFSIFGARVRLTARHSLRKKPAGVYSARGSPPHSHGRHRLRNLILYGLPADESYVIIGPALLIGRGVGLAPWGTHTVPQVEEFGAAGLRRRGKRGRAARSLAELVAYYPARPYMGPAFRRELPKAQELWANSVK